MIVIINFCIKSTSIEKYCLLITFRVDYDIWTTRRFQISCGEVESPFRKLAPHSLLSLPYDDFTPDFVNYFRLTNIFPLRRDFMGHMASEPVQSFRLISSKLCQNSTPLSLKKGCGIGVLKSSMDSTRVAAANYRQKATFCLFLLKLR